jgi:isopenicillin N synthase-like dioxygenase
VNISHSINTTILVALSTALGLPESKRFEKFHGNDTLSSSVFACNKHPKHNATDPDIGHNAHTDIGSVTILFAPKWGLQTFQPGTGEWAYVQPLPEHVVIGIGDALRYMSQSRLHSNLHRVIPMTGTIEQQDRYSFMYFMRPDKNTAFKDSEGNAHTYEERHALKTANFRNNHDAMASYVQTGRKGFLGLWNAPTTNTLDTN